MFLFLSTCITCVLYLQRPEEGHHISDVELELAVSHTVWMLKNSGPRGEQYVLLTVEPSFLFVKKIPLAYNWFFLNFPGGTQTHYIHYSSLTSTIPPSPSARIKGMTYMPSAIGFYPIYLHIGNTATLLQLSVS